MTFALAIAFNVALAWLAFSLLRAAFRAVRFLWHVWRALRALHAEPPKVGNFDTIPALVEIQRLIDSGEPL